jgi:hypothetical protein
VFSIIVVLLTGFNALGAGPIKISNTSTDFRIQDSEFTILEDPSGKISFEEISSPNSIHKFINPSPEVYNQVNTYIWTKFTLLNESDPDMNWILQLPLHSDSITLYFKTADGVVKKRSTGQAMNFNSRSINMRTLAFELPHNRNTPIEVYVHIFSGKHRDLSFIVSSESRYMGIHTKGYLFHGLIYGILFLMALYNVILFLSIKEKIYIYYVVYTLCSIFFISWKDGLGFQFLWPNQPWINAYHYSIGLFLMLISFLVFANDFLEIKKNHPHLQVVTYCIIAINLVYCMLNVVYSSYFDPLPYPYILSYIYFFGLVIYSIKNKYKPARYLIVSLGCMIIALVVIKLRYLGILKWNWFIEYILNYAIAVEVITMSLATRDKITLLRIQKERAREATLIEEKLKTENELIQLKNQQLEGEVVYQNNELAVMANSLTQKSEFLEYIKKELEAISGDIPANSPLKKLIKKIGTDGDFDNHWDQFQLNFDKVYNNFLARFREKYPHIRPDDLLLCAYIRMGKSNKEIASVLNITISGVEKKRLRLKEKLNIDAVQKLSDFILNFS